MNIDSLKTGSLSSTINAIVEGMELATYKFDKYLSKKSESTLKKVNLDTKEKGATLKKLNNRTKNYFCRS